MAGQESSQQAMMNPKLLLAKELANRQAELENQISGVKARYAEPMSKEALTKALLENKYLPREKEADIGYKNASAGHMAELIKASQFERGNPLLKADATKKFGAFLADPRTRPYAEQAIKAMMQGQQQAPEDQQMAQAEQQGQGPRMPQPLWGQSQMPEGMPQQGQSNYGISKEDLIQPGIDQGMKKPAMAPQIPGSETAKHPMQQFMESALQEAMNGGTGEKPNAITAWDRQPVPVKTAEMAQGRAFGFDDTELYNQFRAKKSLADLAEMKGYARDGSDWPQPIYNPSARTINTQQQANIARKGIDAVQPLITKDLAPYASRLKNGVSPAMVYDMVKGGSEEKVGRAVGAAAAAFEINAMRLKSGGIIPGIGALREGLQSSQLNLHTLGLPMSSKEFEIAQNHLSEIINKINDVENKEAFNNKGYAKGKGPKENPLDKAYSDDDIEYTAKKYGMTPDQVREKLRQGK